MFKIHKMTQEQLRMQMLAGIITEGQYKEMLNENEELSIYLVSAEDDPEHSVYALFDNNQNLIKTDFEDIESAKMWAEENEYNITY
jgi:hypothetical protein